jgi:hypothetical protein
MILTLHDKYSEGQSDSKRVKTFKQFNEQIAPSKTILMNPSMESLPHMDTRGPGEKLRNIQLQKKYYDSIGKKPPTV